VSVRASCPAVPEMLGHLTGERSHHWELMAGTEKPDEGLQRKIVSFNMQMGMEAEKCGIEFLKNSGLPSMGRFSEEQSSHLVSKIVG